MSFMTKDIMKAQRYSKGSNAKTDPQRPPDEALQSTNYCSSQKNATRSRI